MTKANTVETTAGYWEPHTSSIDFCETNYLHSNYIAEIHNVWSSIIGLSAVGLFGLLKGNPTKEIRYTMLYLSLFVIGIGSACLHGTLHWVYQSADELPMLYLIICLWYCISECESPRGHPANPHFPVLMVIFAAVNTVIYYAFQNIYLVFIATFSTSTIVTAYGIAELLFFREGRGSAGKRIFCTGMIVYLGISTPLWIFDMLACNRLLEVADNALIMPWWALGITPHVIWHLGAGFAAYSLGLSNSCCRLEVLGIPYDVSYTLGGIWPIVLTREGEKEKSV